MVFVGMIEQIRLLRVFQSVELYEKTGLLRVTQDKEEIRLYFRRGHLIYISFPQEHRYVPGTKRLLQFHVNNGQSSAWAKHEATEIVHNLLTWQSGEVHFDDGAQPQADQLLPDLSITSLMLSYSDIISTSNLTNNNFENAIEKQPISVATPSLSFKTPGLMLRKASIPVTPPAFLATPLPFLFGKSKSVIEVPAIPITPFPQVPVTPHSEIGAKISPIRLPQTFERSSGLLSATRAILPFPDYELTSRLSTPQRRHNFLLRWEVLLIVAVLLIAAIAHGVNMFHYPYYEDDEGTYMSQAWAVVHLGRLAYYTYTYDHAPAGWLLIAAWTTFTGGFHAFGPTINSGRVLMFFMQICSTFMLYCIARSISKSISAAVIASLLFALSPYGIYFHRRVLLDNFTTFWMLLSILLLVSGRLSLKRTWLSALALSLSILSKELTVFIVPVMMYLAFFRADKSHRWLAVIGWIALVMVIVSLYPLMAILKNELFPTGTLLGGTSPHVSLLGTVQYQASRGKDGGFFDFNSGFWYWTKVWIQDDPILVVAGSLCAILSMLLIKKHRLIGIMGLLTLSLWTFLGRGGEVIDFYLVPLLPLLALNIGIIPGFVTKSLMKLLVNFVSIKPIARRIIEQIIIFSCLIGIAFICLGPGIVAGYGSSDIGNNNNPLVFWSSTQADAQNQATHWNEKNLPLSSHMIIDESMWLDLYNSGYRFADYYWKVEQDPAIRNNVYHNDWRNFDYVITTTQMLTDMKRNNMTLVKAALDHSTLITYFDTGGWRVEIRKVNKGGR